MTDKNRNAIIASNIKSLIKRDKITQKKLAESINISPSTLSDYMNLRSNPSHGVIQKIADYFNVLKSDIDSTYKENQPDTTLTLVTATTAKLEKQRQQIVLNTAQSLLQEQEQGNDKIVQFPVKNDVDIYGIVTAGFGSENFEKGQPIETVTLPSANVPKHYDLAFKVSGDSMYPTFEDGEIIFVKKTTEVTNGMIGCVEINKEAFIKKMYLEDGRLRLVSLNCDSKKDGSRLYPDFYADDHDELFIVGRVII